MDRLYAVIGGSGTHSLDDFEIEKTQQVKTPYGPISAELELGYWYGQHIAFLPRHGKRRRIPPHKINYRANLWALKSIGVNSIISINAVGGISPQFAPETIALPDQIIDYTNNREHTFFDGQGDVSDDGFGHVDFTHPFSDSLRERIIQAASDANYDLLHQGCYGCTNGPRLESAAEIKKMKVDGCNLIGMTAMPEAALARELEIEYASIALVVNWCAGIDNHEISIDHIREILASGTQRVQQLVGVALKLI